MDYKPELVPIPVSDLDRATDLYTQAAGVTLASSAAVHHSWPICVAPVAHLAHILDVPIRSGSSRCAYQRRAGNR